MSLAEPFDRRRSKHCRLRGDAWQATARTRALDRVSANLQTRQHKYLVVKRWGLGGAGAARGAVNEACSARLLPPRPVSSTVPLPPPSYPLTLPFATPRPSPLSVPLLSLFRRLPSSFLAPERSHRVKSALNERTRTIASKYQRR